MNRFEFLKLIGLGTMSVAAANPLLSKLGELPDDGQTMPTLFIGHGAPTNVLADTEFTRNLKQLGQELPKPKAILVVSAHWLTRGTFVCNSPKPETIYDFSGFPKEMYEIKYDCPGAPDLAKETSALLTEIDGQLDDDWGLDHGAWTVLYHMYPNADIPVFELSIDYHKAPSYHYEVGQYLQKLRQKGVLIMGSGNMTHNLRQAFQGDMKTTPDWALEFDSTIKSYIDKGDFQAAVDYKNLGKVASMSHPTNDHYLPLLYTLGASSTKDKVSYPHEGFEFGSLSMRCIKFG